jgi:TolB-like protein
MSDDADSSARPKPTVFLSYASEDRRAAQRIRDSLPALGLEVWYDESDLTGGDAWDQKIRRQIRECTYFMPVISAHTEARHEGYFRREWRLAVERTLDMADDHIFLLPVVIDSTVEAGARVPEKFRAVQWLRLPDGEPTAALEALCRRLLFGANEPRASGEYPRITPTAAGKTGGAPPRRFPAFPREEPGQRVRFWFQIAGWGAQCGWIAFMRFPRWLRIGIYCWLAILLMARACSPADHDRSPRISSAQSEKLKEIGSNHPGNWTAADTTQLLTQIAKEIPAAARDDSSTFAPVLAIPFTAPAGDAAAQKLAASVFTQTYGRLAIARHGHVALADQPLSTFDAATAMVQGRAHASNYIVYGAVAGHAPEQQLTVRIMAVTDGSVLWSKTYPAADADPAGIAAEVSARVPRHDQDDE